MGVDIGPGTAAVFSDVILDAGTVLWNGPMGVFEDPRFEAGTQAVAEAMAETRAFTVVGGGDSAAAAKQFGVESRCGSRLHRWWSLTGTDRTRRPPRPRRPTKWSRMTTRRPLISGNWKMHLNHFEALKLVQELSYQITGDDVGLVDVSLHPPFTDIRTVQTVIDSDKIPFFVGAQHCHFEEKGAFTGEVAPSMLPS